VWVFAKGSVILGHVKSAQGIAVNLVKVGAILGRGSPKFFC